MLVSSELCSLICYYLKFRVFFLTSCRMHELFRAHFTSNINSKLKKGSISHVLSFCNVVMLYRHWHLLKLRRMLLQNPSKIQRQSWTKISGENGKKVHFYHYLLIIPPSPYINVELQVFHLTLTLNIDDGGRGDVICAIITNSGHYFVHDCSFMFSRSLPLAICT